jgi:hypothetical protein
MLSNISTNDNVGLFETTGKLPDVVANTEFLPYIMNVKMVNDFKVE